MERSTGFSEPPNNRGLREQRDMLSKSKKTVSWAVLGLPRLDHDVGSVHEVQFAERSAVPVEDLEVEHPAVLDGVAAEDELAGVVQVR